jgi:N-acetylglutamate synthase-like GNAT family acetyltransferase
VESPAYIARRATEEDLPALQGLWQAAGLPWEELETFVTEFQVVPGDEGLLLAAIGLMVESNEALLHSEAVRQNGDQDELRDALWRRIQIVARNQGVHRVWTQEDAEFWRLAGFLPSTPADFARSTASFLQPGDGWSAFQLLDPSRANAVVEEQMAVWQATRQQEAEEFARKVKVFRTVAFLIFAVVLVLILGLLWAVMKTNVFSRLVR